MIADRLKRAIEAFVSTLTTQYDYQGIYGGRVIAQRDNVVDVVLDNPKMPHVSDAKIRYGLPGAKATLTAGARVLVTWEEADPARPVVIAFDAEVSKLTLGGGTGLPRGVARQGDAVAVFLPPLGIPVTGSQTVGGVTTPVSGVLQVLSPLVGVIVTGSGTVKTAS